MSDSLRPPALRTAHVVALAAALGATLLALLPENAMLGARQPEAPWLFAQTLQLLDGRIGDLARRVLHAVLLASAAALALRLARRRLVSPALAGLALVCWVATGWTSLCSLKPQLFGIAASFAFASLLLRTTTAPGVLRAFGLLLLAPLWSQLDMNVGVGVWLALAGLVAGALHLALPPYPRTGDAEVKLWLRRVGLAALAFALVVALVAGFSAPLEILTPAQGAAADMSALGHGLARGVALLTLLFGVDTVRRCLRALLAHQRGGNAQAAQERPHHSELQDLALAATALLCAALNPALAWLHFFPWVYVLGRVRAWATASNHRLSVAWAAASLALLVMLLLPRATSFSLSAP